KPEALVPPVRSILQKATSLGVRAAFDTSRKLAALRRQAARILAGLDFLFVPTTPTIFRIEDIEADPLRLNAVLGKYPPCVNPRDRGALAVPTGLRSDGLPAGATLVGPWGSDARLAAFGAALHRATSNTLGATGRPIPNVEAPATSVASDWIPI